MVLFLVLFPLATPLAVPCPHSSYSPSKFENLVSRLLIFRPVVQLRVPDLMRALVPLRVRLRLLLLRELILEQIPEGKKTPGMEAESQL